MYINFLYPLPDMLLVQNIPFDNVKSDVLMAVKVFYSPEDEHPHSNSSVNVFDGGAVILRSIIWTLSIILMFCNHNVSRDGSSLVIR
jgi:hypothetical protein